MITDRRHYLGLAASLGLLSSLPAPAVAQTNGDRKMIIHHVFFWLNNPGSPQDRDALIAGLKTLKAIPIIRRLHIGVPAPTEQRDVVDSSYDVSELMFFDTVEDQKSYQDHPVHQQFVKNCSHLWKTVKVFDVIDV
jgi:hypothetical protein